VGRRCRVNQEEQSAWYGLPPNIQLVLNVNNEFLVLATTAHTNHSYSVSFFSHLVLLHHHLHSLLLPSYIQHINHTSNHTQSPHLPHNPLIHHRPPSPFLNLRLPFPITTTTTTTSSDPLIRLSPPPKPAHDPTPRKRHHDDEIVTQQ
jgi:hypothetical protein